MREEGLLREAGKRDAGGRERRYRFVARRSAASYFTIGRRADRINSRAPRSNFGARSAWLGRRAFERLAFLFSGPAFDHLSLAASGFSRPGRLVRGSRIRRQSDSPRGTRRDGGDGDLARPHSAAPRTLSRAGAGMRERNESREHGVRACRSRTFVGVDVVPAQIESGRLRRLRARIAEPRAPGSQHHRRGRRRRIVRLHHLPRRVLMGAAGRAGRDPARVPRESVAERRRVRELQHVSRLASPRHAPRHARVPRRSVARSARARRARTRVRARARRVRSDRTTRHISRCSAKR